MSFMYLLLRKREHGIAVTVQNSGNVSTLGTANSRLTEMPFAVFAIDSFDGISAIDTNQLVAELERRLTPSELRTRFKMNFTFEEIIKMLTDNLRR